MARETFEINGQEVTIEGDNIRIVGQKPVQKKEEFGFLSPAEKERRLRKDVEAGLSLPALQTDFMRDLKKRDPDLYWRTAKKLEARQQEILGLQAELNRIVELEIAVKKAAGKDMFGADRHETPDETIRHLESLAERIRNLHAGTEEEGDAEVEARSKMTVLGSGRNAIHLGPGELEELLVDPDKLANKIDELRTHGVSFEAIQELASYMGQGIIERAEAPPEAAPGAAPEVPTEELQERLRRGFAAYQPRPEQAGGGEVQENIRANIASQMRQTGGGFWQPARTAVKQIADMLRAGRAREAR
jgi:hypothetical protein